MFLFRALKLVKNADLDKYFCSGYGIGFDARRRVHRYILIIIRNIF